MNALEMIVKHEGFREKPYPDPLTGAEPFTFGHGLTYITTKESLSIVEGRIKEIEKRLQTNKRIFNTLPYQVRDVLINMAYQLGVDGLMMFRNMWSALESGDFEIAADEMLDSIWARQTPSRAEELAGIVRSFDDA